MSLINVYLTRSHGYIATDTAGYDEEGTLLCWAMKTLPLPHLRCAIGARGRIDVAWRIAGKIGTGMVFGAKSIDDLLPRIDDLFDEAFEESVRFSPLANFEGWIVGWSEAEGRIIGESFLYATVDVPFRGRTGFHRERAPDNLYLAPPLLHEFATTYRKAVVPDTFIDAAKRQRAICRKYAPQHVIGGDLVLTTISRRSVEQKVIYSWPDVLAAAEAELETAGLARM